MTAPPTHHTRSEVFAEPPLACLVLTLVPYIAGLKTPNQGLRPFAKGNAWTPSLLLQVLQVGYPCRPVTGTQLTWIPYKILELYDDDAAEDYLRVVYITGQRLDMLIKVASLFALFFSNGSWRAWGLFEGHQGCTDGSRLAVLWARKGFTKVVELLR